MQPCRFSAGDVAHILFSIGISSDAEVAALVTRLNDAGFPTQDLSSIEAAQVRPCCRSVAPLRRAEQNLTGHTAPALGLLPAAWYAVNSCGSLWRFSPAASLWSRCYTMSLCRAATP